MALAWLQRARASGPGRGLWPGSGLARAQAMACYLLTTCAWWLFICCTLSAGGHWKVPVLRCTKPFVKGAVPGVRTSTTSPGLAGLARASSQQSQALPEGLHRALAWLGLACPGLAWPGSGF
ncbi:predicted protein [Postia placenta Mad-698-R]|nr:predicted protein [Postia placenta Mad-698-R]